jgi:hypothetical protein
MKTPFDKPVLLRCREDGAPFAVVSTDDGEVLTVCPVCGSGGYSKDVLDYSSGLISGIFSEEQLIDLRKQISIFNKNSFSH